MGDGVVCLVCMGRTGSVFAESIQGWAKHDDSRRGYEIGAGRERVTLLRVRVAGPLPPAVFLRSVRRAKRQSTLAHCAQRPGPLKLTGGSPGRELLLPVLGETAPQLGRKREDRQTEGRGGQPPQEAKGLAAMGAGYSGLALSI